MNSSLAIADTGFSTTGRPSTINEMKVYNTLRGTWFFRKTIYVSLFAILTV